MIFDGTLDTDTQKVKLMPLRIYFDTVASNSAGQPLSGESMKTLVEEHMQSKTAMSFFCVSGAQDDRGRFCFRNTKHTFITKAEGTKADRLTSNAELHNL